MHKKLLALSFALVLCVCPVFAVSDADNSYYSFEPVSDYTLADRSLVALAASSAGWTDTDHGWLNQIRLALTQSGTGSILGYLQSIDRVSDKIFSKLIDIKSSTDYLRNINNNTNSIVSKLASDLKGSDILSLLNDAHLDWLAKESTLASGLFNQDGYSRLAYLADNNVWLHPRLRNWLAFDGYDIDYTDNPTLYHYVKNLSETLASDDDKALAESQKPNRDQIEQDFVSGSSGNTSLGSSDFGDLSSVGGSVKGSISLNGQSSVSGFTGGLSDADEAGQGWFSASTRDALDTVSSSSSSSSSSSFSSRARRAPDDTYNMAGFAEHYSWLYGE